MWLFSVELIQRTSIVSVRFWHSLTRFTPWPNTFIIHSLRKETNLTESFHNALLAPRVEIFPILWMVQAGSDWTAPSTVPVEPGAQAATSPACVATEERATRWTAAARALQAGEGRGANTAAR